MHTTRWTVAWICCTVSCASTAAEAPPGSAATSPSATHPGGRDSAEESSSTLPVDGDCEDCEIKSAPDGYQTRDGARHACVRSVGPVDCGAGHDETEGYCVMEEACDPGCCR